MVSTLDEWVENVRTAPADWMRDAASLSMAILCNGKFFGMIAIVGA